MNKKILSLFLFVLIIPNILFAQYISDEFQVMVRSGPSIENKIIKVVKSGDAINISELNATENYSKILLDNGSDGFILTRFITQTTPAKNQVAQLNAKIAQLSANPEKSQVQLLQCQQNRDIQQKEKQQCLTHKASVEKEFAYIQQTASDEISIIKKNQRLESEIQKLLLQTDALRIENKNLKDHTNQNDKFIGAGLILLGLFLGWLLTISKSNKKGPWRH